MFAEEAPKASSGSLDARKRSLSSASRSLYWVSLSGLSSGMLSSTYSGYLKKLKWIRLQGTFQRDVWQTISFLDKLFHVYAMERWYVLFDMFVKVQD